MPATRDIPADVRSAILTRIEKAARITPVQLGEEFLMEEGLASFDDFIASIGTRFGDDEAQHTKTEMDRLAQRDAGVPDWTGQAASPMQQARWLAANTARYALIAAPDAEFIKGVQYALRLIIDRYAQPGDTTPPSGYARLVAQIDDLFAKRAIPYAVTDGQITWSGDRGLHETVNEPALQALADPRLAGARAEYEAARSHLRAGTMKDREDAIDEAAKAVESALKVLAAETNTAVPANATVKALFDHLSNANILPAYTDNLIQSAARIRNKRGGHGAGAQPRQIDPDEATATVSAAATAIVYLASRLP